VLEGILIGVATAFSPTNIMLAFAGCFSGTIIGMLPGLGPIAAIALLIPVTYGLEPASAMILLAGVYYGAVFGGSTSAILINAPGIAGVVATAFDGYPMAKAGMAGKALAIAAISSFAGGTIAAVFLLLAAPSLVQVALSFQSAEYFALMVFGLIAVAAFAGRGEVLKALLATFVGLALATVGLDSTVAIERFTFGVIDLTDGISFLLLAMACFALSEVLISVLRSGARPRDDRAADVSNLGSLRLSGAELRNMAPPIARSSVIGFFVGVLPGAGATIASFLGYGLEQRLAGKREAAKFGKGSIRGLAAPEAANNAAASGSFVPLLTLGIPGSATGAVLLGALISYGVRPGPRLAVETPEVFWSVIVSMYVGNMFLLILNLPLIPYIARLLMIPRPILLPLIAFFSLIGVYFVSFNTFDIHLLVLFAVCAVGLRLLDFPLAPLLLGFILGGPLEENLRRALVISADSFAFLWERPLTLGILIAAALFLFAPAFGPLLTARLRRLGLWKGGESR